MIRTGLALVLLALGGVAETGPSAATLRRIAELRRDYGIVVHYRFDAKRFFPGRWRQPPNSVQAEAVALRDVDRLVAQVHAFVQRYPQRVIRKNLENVYLLGSFAARGKQYGGTYFGRSLYVVAFSDEFVRSRLHSEFSSILMRNYRFPYGRWRATNEAGWRYGGGGFRALGRADLYEQSPRLLERGFVVRYAQTSIENDFNMMSDWMFTRPDELAQLARRYQRIKAKMQVAYEFYVAVWRA